MADVARATELQGWPDFYPDEQNEESQFYFSRPKKLKAVDDNIDSVGLDTYDKPRGIIYE